MNRKLSLILLLLILASAVLSFGQTQTGSIRGRVLGEKKQPLEGVALAVFGPALMGQMTYFTTGTGLFKFPSLAPGVYDLRADMPGHKTKLVKGLVVNIGKTVEITIDLEPSNVEEEVAVAARPQAVDVRSTKPTVTYDPAFLAAVPMPRDLYAFQNSLPGAVSEGVEFRRSSSILGGTVRSQLYLLDGAVMNDPATSYPITDINTEIIEEMEISLGSLPAEVGQTDAVVLNIMSKTGGNAWAGGATFYYGNKSLTKELFSASDLQAFGVNPPEKYSVAKDYSFNLHGPLWYDRGWIYLGARFLSWTRTNPYAPEARMAGLGFTTSPHYDIDHSEFLGFVKVNIRPIDQIRYTGQLHYSSINEPVFANAIGPAVSYENAWRLDHEKSYATSHQFSFAVDQNTEINARGMYVFRLTPLTAVSQRLPTSYDFATDVWWGSAPYNEESKLSRMAGSVAVTRFWDRVLGFDHEFKFGAEFEQDEYHRDWYRANPYVTYWNDYAARDPYSLGPYQGRFDIYPGPEAKGQWDIQDGYRRFSAYLQDKIVRGRLTLSLGLRFEYNLMYEPQFGRPILLYSERPELLNPEIEDQNSVLQTVIQEIYAQNAYSPFDLVIANYRKPAEYLTLSPRLGAAFDLSGDGRTALKMSYARYFEPLWISKYNRGDIFVPHAVAVAWNDLNRNGLMDVVPDDSYDVLDPGVPQNPATNPYVNLKPPTTDEVVAGIERDIAADFKLGLDLIWKKSRNLIATIDSANGYDASATDAVGPIWLPFSFTEPGPDGTFGTPDDRRMTAYGLRQDRPDPVWSIVNVPKAERNYWAVMLSFDKRMSHRWLLKGSVVYSSFKGNFGAGDGAAAGLSPVFDSPNVLTNASGPLWFDRPWQVKIAGAYLLPWNISVGAYFQYASGIPWQRTLARVYFPANYMGYGVKSPGWVALNAEAAGSRRGPAFMNLDIRVEKTFALGRSGTFALFLDAFNVTGRSVKYLYQDSAARLAYNLYPDGTQAAYTADPNFGKVASVAGVRAIRLGARIGF